MSPRLTLCPGDTLYSSLLCPGDTPLLCSGEPLLFSTLGHFYYSLLCYPPLLFSSLLCPGDTLYPSLLCPALLPTSSLLCSTLATLPWAQLSPGTNLEQGSMLHWAAQERKGEGRKQFVQKERKHHNSVPVKTHFVHSPHQPTNFCKLSHGLQKF